MESGLLRINLQRKNKRQKEKDKSEQLTTASFRVGKKS
jgi:hypothetical protein